MGRAIAERTKGFMALLGAAVLFGSTGAFVTVLDGYFTEPGQLITRSAIVVFMVVLLSRLMRAKFDIKHDQLKYLVGIGVLYALSTSCFIYAVTSMKASTALFMLYVGVVVVTQFLGAIWFREGFGRKNIIALIMIASAFFIYIQPVSSVTVSIGLLIAFAGGACEALSYAVRKGNENLTKESVTAAQALGGLGIGIVFLAANSQGMVTATLSPFAIVAMLVLGAIYVGIGYLITYGMRHYSLGMGSVLLSCDLLFALVINAIFLRQTPTFYEIVGCIVLFGCIAYTTNFAEEPIEEIIEEVEAIATDEPPAMDSV